MFSVITITHNREELLKKSIYSVLNQSCKEFTYYIVDDGSTDNTASMIDGIKDERIRYIFSAHTGRLSVLRNIALDRSEPGIIAFLDSDDYWEGDYLQKLKKIYDSSDIMSVISNACVWDRDKQKILFNRDFLGSVKKKSLKPVSCPMHLLFIPVVLVLKKIRLR